MSGISQAVWTAIRELHGGVLRTPYGVLVCSKKLVMRGVRQSRDGDYTVTGYAERMRKSFGEIYLGKDDGARRRSIAQRLARRTRRSWQVTREDAFESALEQTKKTLRLLVGDSRRRRNWR